MNTQPKSKPIDYPGYYEIHDIFDTIQGEGPFAGMPATFIRLAGCNLQCRWCDTNYEYQGNMEISRIMQEINHKLVVITGGEPFRQDIRHLIIVLNQHDHEVQIETNGTLSLPEFPWNGCTVVCSPKTDVHPDFLANCKHWKFVFSAKQKSFTLNQAGIHRGKIDLGAGKPITITPQMSAICLDVTNNIYIMPLTDENERLNTNGAIDLCMELDWRLCLRLHNLLLLP